MQDYQEPDIYQPPSPAGAFLQIMLGVIFLLLVIVGLVAGWGTFVKGAPTLVQVLVVLVAIAGPGAVIVKGAKAVYLDIQHGRAVYIRVQMDEERLQAMEDARKRENDKADAEAERIRAEAARIRAEAEKLLSTIECDDQGNAARWDPETRRIIQLQGQMREHPALHSISYRYDYRDTSSKVSEEQPSRNLLGAGDVHIPTFAESLAAGEIGPGQRDMLHCYELLVDEMSGQITGISPVRGEIGSLHTQFIVAGSQSGKTTYMSGAIAQAAFLRTLFYIVDPHKNHPEKSISAKVAAFKDYFILPPASTHEEIKRLLAHATRTRDHLIQGRPTPYQDYHLMVIVDEVPALMAYQRSQDKSIKQLYIDLALFMQSIGTQTAKFGMTGLFASQFATKDGLGEIEIRDACMSQFIMRLHPTQAQAMRILGTEVVRAIPKLPKGHGYLMLSDSTEARRVAAGNVTINDLSTVAALLPPSPLAKQGRPAQNRFAELDQTAETSSVIPIRSGVILPDETSSKPVPNQFKNLFSPAMQARLGEVGISEAYMRQKVKRVTEMLGQKKADIMLAVWGVYPNRSEAYKQAEGEYNLVMEIIRGQAQGYMESSEVFNG